MKTIFLIIFFLSSLSIAGDFSLTLDNDMFNGSDRHYTHGTRFACLLDDAPDWVNNWLKNNDNKMGYSLAQHMYTPSDISIKELQLQDRPYGGWLYVGLFLYSRNGNWFDCVEIDTGVTGPYSFSGDLQTCMHKASDSEIPMGWDNQIKTEPGLDIVYEKKYRFRYDGRIDADFIPYSGACLGNIFTHINIGCLGRFGYNIPDNFGFSRIEPTPRKFEWFGLYMFVIAEERYVIRNIFLDGNTWKNSHYVEKEDLITDLAYGIGIDAGNLELLLGSTHRTKEFKLQKEDNNFSTLIISWKF